MRNIYVYTIAGLLVFLAGGMGYFFGYSKEHKVLVTKLDELSPIREHDSSYVFIDPLLAYIIPSADQEGELAKLKNTIVDYINLQKSKNRLVDVSIFFSNLNQGRWIGVQENQKYTPASMLKVVIMVAYLKISEKNPDILNQQLTYTKEINDFVVKDPSNTSSDLKIGSTYGVQDLINIMIKESDNGAEYLLLSHVEESELNYIYSILDIENPHGKDNFTISPRLYSLFFRILYSATYLSKDNSEKALDILSKTTFNDGLVAGLPQGTIASHKFGQHIGFQNIELHDCGIIYIPKNPYLLCIMTRGDSVADLKETIKAISDMIYERQN